MIVHSKRGQIQNFKNVVGYIKIIDPPESKSGLTFKADLLLLPKAYIIISPTNSLTFSDTEGCRMIKQNFTSFTANFTTFLQLKSKIRNKFNDFAV